MITSSPSPTLNPSIHSSSNATFAASGHYNYSPRSFRQPHAQSRRAAPNTSPRPPTGRSITPKQETRSQMVDAGTQYSPPDGPSATVEEKVPRRETDILSPPPSQAPSSPNLAPQNAAKRTEPPAATIPPSGMTSEQPSTASSPKRPRPNPTATKILPADYSQCATADMVLLISNMLMELIRCNDAIPLQDGHLTRFHSRAPPGISVLDYLRRLTTHATLSPPILLSMIYYIDRLCALYPAFTISSLTVHRFLITAATVASKGLSDSFWTNTTYARVGGVSIRELALLELEFLGRVDWKIVPRPEVLVDYYRSLVDRCDGFEIAGDEMADS